MSMNRFHEKEALLQVDALVAELEKARDRASC
jgi:hypothetical protein